MQKDPISATSPDIGDADDAAGSSADRVYGAIVDRIIEGRLRPGDALNEVALAEAYGVSRTPIREAVQRLAIAGLAERGARRSFQIRRLPMSELADLFEAMTEIEALCARLSALRMSEVERHRFEDCVRAGAEAVARGDGDTYAALNTHFHQMLLEGARNRSLEEIANLLRVRAAPYREAQFRQTDRIASSHVEHERILAAILARDGAAAQAATTAHLASSSLNITRMLEQPQRGDRPLIR